MRCSRRYPFDGQVSERRAPSRLSTFVVIGVAVVGAVCHRCRELLAALMSHASIRGPLFEVTTKLRGALLKRMRPSRSAKGCPGTAAVGTYIHLVHALVSSENE